jgi:opacity protein-like surface antigen
MKTTLFAAALLAGLLSAPAFAQTKVGDWEVEKRAKDEHCNATRAYKDADDEDRQNVIVLTYSKDAIVIVLVYEGWEWEKSDKIVRADFGTDKTTIVKKAKWEVMDKNTVRGIFEYNQSILDALGKAKRISLDFENDDDDSTEFDVPRAGEALAALKFCEENRK